MERFPALTDETSILRQTLADIAAFIQSKGGQVAQGVLSSISSVVSALVFIVVVPVVSFYMLLDWDKMVARVDELLPRDHAPVVRHLARQIDQVLAGFVRGQLSVCLVLGTYYSVALMLAGLDFGLVVGQSPGRSRLFPMSGRLSAAFWPSVWRCSSSGAIGCRSGLWRRFSRRASFWKVMC